jgi:hypothetical protein
VVVDGAAILARPGRLRRVRRVRRRHYSSAAYNGGGIMHTVYMIFNMVETG